MVFLLFFVFFIIILWTVVKTLIDYWYITVPAIALIIIYAKIKSNRARAKKDSKSTWHEREEWTRQQSVDDEYWHESEEWTRQQSAEDESSKNSGANAYDSSWSEWEKRQRRKEEKWEREHEEFLKNLKEEDERFKKWQKETDKQFKEAYDAYWRILEKYGIIRNIGKYYKVLGLDRNATLEQIKARYRELALKWHPDRNKAGKGQATKKFTKINDAYEKIIENMRVEECTP